jgi:hypothetical protein
MCIVAVTVQAAMQVGRANFCTLLLAGVYRSIIISRKLQLSRITSASENIHPKEIVLKIEHFKLISREFYLYTSPFTPAME